MFDTHAHIHDAVFDADRLAMLARAREAGVRRIMTIGTDVADSGRARATALAHGLDYAIGIHPHEAEGAPADIAAAFDEIVSDRTAAAPRAIGEMGLDHFYAHSARDVQRTVLIAQLRYARERAIPAVFHQRDAFDDFVAIMRAEGESVRGVIHCFTGDAEQAKTYVEEFGLRLGIGGVLTFKNAGALRDAVTAVGLDHLILETDCPYLAPIPHRGRRNEPAFMSATAQRLADLFDTNVADVVGRTTVNAEGLFGVASASGATE